MAKKCGDSAVPIPSRETVRQKIVSLLEGGRLTALELSLECGIPERDVFDHLGHIQKSIGRSGQSLVVTPAACRRCHFVFRKRERLKKPGRCPVCRSETIRDPVFSIKK